jgi:regulator of protease activity HflC (stomatin/prohibitin superfamily)
MKRAEQLAWAALAGLLAVAGILLAGGIMYRFTGYWAGMMLALGQGLAVALAAWGLMLARQAAELHELPGMRAHGRDEDAASGFRMSMGDESPTVPTVESPENARTLDTGFQRLLVGLTGLVLIILAVIAGWMVYSAYKWANLNPDQTLPIAGTYDKPMLLDELGLVIGLGAAGLYGLFWWITRVNRKTEGYGEAVAGTFTLGIAGMAALGAAAVLGYFRVSYASELAAGVIAALMLLQGLELLANSLRSYSSIEELDQEAIDLQAMPLGPMLGSVWLSGLKMLFAQSVGLSGDRRESAGVIARLMPRALLAIVVIAIAASCLRVVKPGEVAVLERLGYAPYDPVTHRLATSALLGPGLHLTLPWPMDELVRIPTKALQLTAVGTELHAPKDWKNVDFQFWTVRGGATESEENEDEFLTGDSSQQLLETYVQVQWRVADPAKFYTSLSHSDFYEKGAGETKTLPIYKAMVQQCTSYAVTQAFAIHSLDDIMINHREEVESHCRQILQDKLDSLDSGIEVVYLTIKDLHPPFWREDRPDPTQPEIGGVRMQRGPASAFEFVVTMSEVKQRAINVAEARATATVTMANGTAEALRANAEADRSKKVADARGDAQRMVTMTENITGPDAPFQLNLLERHLYYQSMSNLFDPVNKVIYDPSVQVQLYQTTPNGSQPLRPPG